MKRVVFIDTVHPILWERLSNAGYTCEAHYQTPLTELEDLIPNYEGIVIRSRIKLNDAFLAKATQLKWIARSGAGMENIDLAYAQQKGVRCLNSPEGNKDAVGEQAIAMLLMLFNRLKIADAEVRKGTWLREENRGVELGGKTIGIIGYGHMGQAFAKKLRGFDCEILAYDKYKKGFGNEYVAETSLADLQKNADVISLHLPLSEETNYFVNAEFIAACLKPFYLVNTARGQNVQTTALIQALNLGKILGACLDVIEFEQFNFEALSKNQLPLAWEQLLAFENVILSPHIAGWTHESHFKLANVLADKILAE